MSKLSKSCFYFAKNYNANAADFRNDGRLALLNFPWKQNSESIHLRVPAVSQVASHCVYVSAEGPQLCKIQLLDVSQFGVPSCLVNLLETTWLVSPCKHAECKTEHRI